MLCPYTPSFPEVFPLAKAGLGKGCSPTCNSAQPCFQGQEGTAGDRAMEEIDTGLLRNGAAPQEVAALRESLVAEKGAVSLSIGPIYAGEQTPADHRWSLYKEPGLLHVIPF